MRRECGIALEPNALARLRREQVIRPDNPSFIGAVALPSLLGKRLRLLPAATSAVAGQFRIRRLSIIEIMNREIVTFSVHGGNP